MNFKNWIFPSHSDFKYNLNYLYLGAKQKRELWADFYGDMYSHLRGEYTIFYYQKMWLNYIKKINLINRITSDKRNNLFFITNRLEHLKFLSSHANRFGANAVFFERDGQFSKKCGLGDSFYSMDKKSNQLGASNRMGGADYMRANSKVFILLVNNNTNDRAFLKNLVEAQRKILVFSPADTNSLYTDRLIPIFGNNDSFKSWNFYLNLFAKKVRLKRASTPGEVSTQYRARPFTLFSTRINKWTPTPTRSYFSQQMRLDVYSKPHSTRAARGASLQKFGVKHRRSPQKYAYDADSGIFKIKSPFHFINTGRIFNPFVAGVNNI